MEHASPSVAATDSSDPDVEALIASTKVIATAHELFLEAQRRLSNRMRSQAGWRIRRRAPDYLDTVAKNMSMADAVYATAYRSMLDRLYQLGIPSHLVLVDVTKPLPGLAAMRDIRAAMKKARAKLPGAIRAVPPNFPEVHCLIAVRSCLDAALDGLPKPVPTASHRRRF